MRYIIKSIVGYLRFLKKDKLNQIFIPSKNYKNIRLKIEGMNNKVVIEDNAIDKKAKIVIKIFGDNNEIYVKKGFIVSEKLNITIGYNHPNYGKVTNSKIFIDENTYLAQVSYITYNSNSFLKIGKNCMFAFGINIYNTDAHPIYNYETQKIINRVKGINIGNHCWIGANSTILKNTTIADDSIIGWGGGS